MYKKMNALMLLFAGAINFNIPLDASATALPKCLIIAHAVTGRRTAFYDGNQWVIPGTINKNQTRSQKGQVTRSLNRINERYRGDFRFVVDMVEGLENSKIIDTRMTAHYTLGRLHLHGYTSADGQYKVPQDPEKAQSYFKSMIQESQNESDIEWGALGHIDLGHVCLTSPDPDYAQAWNEISMATTPHIQRVNPVVYQEGKEGLALVQTRLQGLVQDLETYFDQHTSDPSVSHSSGISPVLSSISSSSFQTQHEFPVSGVFQQLAYQNETEKSVRHQYGPHVKRREPEVDGDHSDSIASDDHLIRPTKRARQSKPFEFIDETSRIQFIGQKRVINSQR